MKKDPQNLIVGTLRVLKKIVWKSSTVEFFYTLAPPGFEPGTSHTLAERATDVATKSERILAKKLLFLNFTLFTVCSLLPIQFLP